jgi:hypothetical protein
MPYNANINMTQSATKSKIGQLNFLTGTTFTFQLDWRKYPNVEYSLQSANIPEVSVQPAPLNLPQRNITLAADKIEYAPLDITFIIDEEMMNYMEIHDWIVGNVTEKDAFENLKTRDLSLTVLSSKNNFVREFKFVDAHPISLSTVPFDTTKTDVEYIVAQVSFNYSYFVIR